MSEPTLLLVEDNPATRKMVSFALSERGYTVVEAPNGATARELMVQKRPSLVLLDLVLPDTDGFTLVQELRARADGTEPTIIAFSGFLSRLDEKRLAAVGFDDVISKPVEPARLATLLDGHRPRDLSDEDRFGSGYKVLVVDDDPLQQKLIRHRLAQLGFEIVSAFDGHSALAMMEEVDPDLVVADVMMPKLDGFELAMAVRRSGELRSVPVVLVTSSYIDPADRELALQSGASDLVVRTPDLDLLVATLRETVGRPVDTVRWRPEEELGQEHTRRVIKQLERQVHLNGGLTQRCAALGAELAVLTRISSAVLRNRSLDEALDEALAACFDAGGISIGALYELASSGELRVRSLGSGASWDERDLAGFFGHEALLRRIIDDGKPVRVPSDDIPGAVTHELLKRSEAKSVLVMPLSYLTSPLGALVMFARGLNLDAPDWRAFTEAVANQISQVLALARAFEERRQARQLAQERTAFLDALLEQAPDHVVYVDCEGIVRYASRLAQEEIHHGEEIIGSSLFSLSVGSTVEARRRHLAQVLETGEPVSFEGSLLRADGEEVPYWCKMGPVRREGRIVGAVILARDISDRKRADAQLMASDRLASLGMLAAGVAHEVNNPLAAVVANLDVVVRDLKTHPGTVVAESVVAGLDDAREGADRIRTIVRDLRVFSRTGEDERGAVDLERLLESTLRIAWNEIRHRAQVVRDYGSVPPVEANEARLGQVFLNLVVNAAQAIPVGNREAHTIRIATEVAPGGRVVTRIGDTGAGIPEELQRKVFTPFFSTKPVGEGTGLGLSICHRIVQELDGEIEFDSTPGGGTEFRVILPQASSLADAKKAAPEVVPRAAKRGRVLVVDDELLIVNVVESILGPEHEVVTSIGAEGALEILARGESFDVVLCDIMMPQVTGMDFYERLVASDRAQAEKVVFLTGGAFTPWARDFLDTVPNTRVDKPFDVQGLRALVNSLVQ